MTDTKEPSSDSVLESIMARPAMYWGNSDNHFHSFVAFVSGYQIARDEIVREDARRELDQIIPPKFHQFVTEYYGHTFPHGGHGWTSFIEDNSESDREALDLFVKLRKLYDERTKRGEQDGARQPTTAPDSKSEGSGKPKPEPEGRSQ